MRLETLLPLKFNGGKNKSFFREKQVIAFKSFLSCTFAGRVRESRLRARVQYAKPSRAEFFLDFLGRKLILAPSF